MEVPGSHQASVAETGGGQNGPRGWEVVKALGRGGTFKASFSAASSSDLCFTPSRSASNFPFWKEEGPVMFTSANGDVNTHS